jgi:hypothetical protein
VLFWLFYSLGTDSALLLRAQGAQSPLVSYPEQRDAAQKAVSWLVTSHQNQDGGYSSFSVGADQAASDVGGTLDAILAFSSAGISLTGIAPGRTNNPIDYLNANVDQLQQYAASDGGQAGKAVLALAAAGQDPRNFAGFDLVSILVSQLSATGQFGSANPFSQALAILALEASGEQVPATALSWLISQQADDGDLSGSWDDGFGTAGNVDATAMSVMALAATGPSFAADTLDRAADFLSRSRLSSGGWEYAAGFGENANSTAVVVQALGALGIDYYTAIGETSSPLMALLSWQGESGAFQADFGDGRFDDFYATVQALPAVVGKPFPLPGKYEAARRALACLATLQDPQTGGWEQFATFGVDAAGTSRAIQAIAAMGEDPASSAWSSGDVNAVQALAALTPVYLATAGGGAVGIVLQGVIAAGGDVGSFAGIDLALAVSGHLSPTGEYDSTAFGPFSHTEAMLGLLAAGQQVDPSAVEWLLNAHSDGDFGGADSTGIAMQALARLGLELPAALDAVRASQELDGGWGFGAANPSSTSEVVQGLVAFGENPFGLAWSKVLSGTVVTPADAILRQQGENGCWPNLFGPGDDPFSTTDAILMLAAQPAWGKDRQVVMAELISAEPQVTETAEPAQISESTTAPTETAAPAEIATQAATLVPTSPPTEPAQAVATSVVSAVPEEPASSSTLPLVLVGAALLLVIIAAVYLYRRR